MLIKVVEEIPRVLRDDEDLAAFELASQECLPLFEEPAILRPDEQVPQAASQLHVYVPLALLLCEIEGEVVHLLVLGFVVELRSEARDGCSPAGDRVAAESLAASVELVPRELSHVLGLHVLRDFDEHDVSLRVDSDLAHERVDPVIVHHRLAHVVPRAEPVEERPYRALVNAGRRR